MIFIRKKLFNKNSYFTMSTLHYYFSFIKKKKGWEVIGWYRRTNVDCTYPISQFDSLHLGAHPPKVEFCHCLRSFKIVAIVFALMVLGFHCFHMFFCRPRCWFIQGNNCWIWMLSDLFMNWTLTAQFSTWFLRIWN